MNPFIQPSRAATWHRAGRVSDFPEIGSDSQEPTIAPKCKAFTIPKDGRPAAQTTAAPAGDLKDQVLVFQYKGKFHAIDHQCPHSSYPLSNGNLFDIEDFGITLSAGITCPKHGWSFDLFSGQADRGNYRLNVWEVQVRGKETEGAEKEVYVRRKQRIG